MAQFRAKVEHMVRTIKEHFGFRKARLLSMAKYRLMFNLLAVLSTLYPVRAYPLATELVYKYFFVGRVFGQKGEKIVLFESELDDLELNNYEV